MIDAPRTLRRSAAMVFVAGLLLAGSAGVAEAARERGASAFRPQASSPRCAPLRDKGTGFVATITAADEGERFCLTTGESVLVELAPPTTPRAPHWSPITISTPGVLGAESLGTKVPSRDTARRLKALGVGSVELRSSRHVCPPATATTMSCDAMIGYEVTVVVRKAPTTGA